MKEDLDSRFGRFERALERIAGPDSAQQPPAVAPEPQLPAQTPTITHRENEPAPQPKAVPQAGNPHSTFMEMPDPPLRTLERTPSLTQYQQESRQRMRQPVASAASGINNNNTAWEQWMSTNKPIAAYQSAASATPFNTKEAYDAVIDAQVRHIMENAPHQLKGTVPRGKFPFNYLTRGPEKRKLSFNKLTLPEHIFGIFGMIEDPEVDPGIKPNLIAHMREVAEDSCKFEWSTNLRRWSEEVFNLVAERRLPEGWNSTARIQNLRTGISRADGARLASHKDSYNNNSRQYNTNHQPDNLRGGPPCQDFNSSAVCPLQSGHMIQGKRQIHVCAYCLANTAAVHPHSEAHCRTRQKHGAHHF